MRVHSELGRKRLQRKTAASQGGACLLEGQHLPGRDQREGATANDELAQHLDLRRFPEPGKGNHFGHVSNDAPFGLPKG